MPRRCAVPACSRSSRTSAFAIPRAKATKASKWIESRLSRPSQRRGEFCGVSRSVARSVRIAREHARRTHDAKGSRLYRCGLCDSGRDVWIVFHFLELLARGGSFALLVPHRRIVTVQGQQL